MAKAKYTYNEKRNEWRTLVWDGTFNADGSKHRKYISSHKSSADLERKVNALKESIKNNSTVFSSNMTFGEYARRWLNVAKQTKELNTQRMYKNIISVHLSFLDNVLLTQITHLDFQTAINRQINHPNICRQINITFKQIIKMAVKERFLPRTAIEDILEGISLPKVEKSQKRALNEVEKRAIKEAVLDDKKRAFITLLYYTGIRRQEALALSADCFLFSEDTNYVKIKEVIIFDGNDAHVKPYPKSNNGIREIPLTPQAVEILKPYVANCEGYLFKTSGRTLMTKSSYQRMWESILVSLNLACGYDPQKVKEMDIKPQKPISNLTAHVFRHNYCTELCYQIPQISTKMIARLLGDSEKMVLDVYSHIKEEKEDVLSSLSSALDF